MGDGAVDWLCLPRFDSPDPMPNVLRLEFDPDRMRRAALLLALGLTIVGFLGKFAAGYAAWGGVRRSFIGAGMVPRGQVGLIFASIGRATGALPERVFVAVVLTVFATTFIAPPLLKALRPNRSAQPRPRPT